MQTPRNPIYQRVTNAFRELRSLGYFAKQNFLCCQSCGVHAVPESHAERYVFYHGQDADRFRAGEDLYLAWDGDADEIVAVLTKHGLIVEHDGDPAVRIKVVWTPAYQDEDGRLFTVRAYTQ